MSTADAVIKIRAEDKTQKAFNSVNKNMNKTSDALKGLAKRFVMMAGAAGIGGFIKGTIDMADKLDKLSIRLGMSTAALSEYQHVANMAGVSFETLTMGLQRMTRRIAEAAQGFGEAKGALKELNLDAATLNAMPIDQKFEAIAEALSGVGNDADQVRLAMKLFDSEGVALLQTMEGGADGIRRFREQAIALGLSLDAETTSAAARFKENMVVLTGTLKGLAYEALPPLLTALNGLVKAITGGIAFVKQFGDELALLAKIIFTLYAASKLTAILGALGIALRGVAASATAAKVAFIGLNTVLKKNIIGIALALGVTLHELWSNLKTVKEEAKAVGKEFKSVSPHLDAIDKAGKKVAKTLTDIDKATLKVGRSILAANKEIDEMPRVLSEADKRLVDFRESLAEIENKKMMDKAFNAEALLILDKAFLAGKISLETYKEQLVELGETYKDIKGTVFDLEKVLAHPSVHEGEKAWEGLEKKATKAEEALKSYGESFRDLIGGIDGSWTKMWKDLFSGGKTETVLKSFLNRVKDMFLDTLAEIAAAWTKKKLIEIFTGGTGGGNIFSTITSIFTSGATEAATTAGNAAGSGFLSTITSAVTGGASKIGSAITNMFSGFSSSGTLIADGAGGFQMAGQQAASSFVTGAKTALANAAGFAVPLAIAAFGFGKSQRFKKKLRAKFKEVMSDPTIVSNLADGPLGNGFKELGQVGEESFVQISSAARKMFQEFSETSGGIGGDRGGPIGMMTFGLKEMKDEFGNVIVSATKYNELMAHLKEMQPFVDHAQHIMDTIPANERLREGIELVNSESFRAKVLFEGLGEEGKKALRGIEVDADSLSGFMRRGFVTSAELAQMGLENMGQMSSEMFEELIGHANDATGAVDNLARAAQNATNATQSFMDMKTESGFQHGGSFIVGGSGGTDKTPVSFMATRGERVSIETPNQSQASGSDGSGVVKELRALRSDLANVVAKPIVGAVTRGQLAVAGGARH